MATYSENPSKDATISSNNADTNYGSETYLALNAAVSATWYTLIEFDISSLGTNQLISVATLNLNRYPSGDDTVTIYRLLRTDWVEAEVTWNSYKSGSVWSTAGGDYDTLISKSFTPAVGDNSVDVLELVRDAHARGLNVELLLTSSVKEYRYFYSSESESNKPSLDITYATDTSYSSSESKYSRAVRMKTIKTFQAMIPGGAWLGESRQY